MIFLINKPFASFLKLKNQTTDETIDNTNLNTEEISSTTEHNHVHAEQIIEEPAATLEININENHINSNQTTEEIVADGENNVNELPIESNQITVTEELNEPPLTINDDNNEIVENTIVCIYRIDRNAELKFFLAA